MLTFEAQHLGYLRKDEASRCERNSADQGWVSKAGKWSPWRYPSVQWSHHVTSRLMSLHICSHTLPLSSLCGTGTGDIWDISNNTPERKILSGCREEKKYTMYDSQYLWRDFLTISANSDCVGHGMARLFQQSCISLPWRNGLCLPYTVWRLCKPTVCM